MSKGVEVRAGRELDERVAAEVMGWTFVTFPDGVCPEVKHWHREDGEHVALPGFSTSIAAAWRVVEKLNGAGFSVYVGKSPTAQTWDVRGWKEARAGSREHEGSHFIEHADTAPLAICLAALASTSTEG